MTVRRFVMPEVKPDDVQLWTFGPTGDVYVDDDGAGVLRFVPLDGTDVWQLVASVDTWTPAAFAGAARDVRVIHGYPPTVELRGPRETWHALDDAAALVVLQLIARTVLLARSVIR